MYDYRVKNWAFALAANAITLELYALTQLLWG
jgi:hypothetical protein